MSADGVFRSANQCRIKLKALKTKYKKNINHNNLSGRERKILRLRAMRKVLVVSSRYLFC